MLFRSLLRAIERFTRQPLAVHTLPGLEARSTMPADDRRPGGGNGPRREGGRSFGNGPRFGDNKRPSAGGRFGNDAPRGEGRPASPWASEGRRSDAPSAPRHPEHRTEFPHVAKRSSTHHNAGGGFGGARSEGAAGKPRAGRTFNRDR